MPLTVVSIGAAAAAQDPAELECSVADVGALLPARTKEQMGDGAEGDEAGTFTEDTRPTATQVRRYIRTTARDASTAAAASADSPPRRARTGARCAPPARSTGR